MPFSKQIINVDKCILQVSPGLRLAQSNKGVYWQVTFRTDDLIAVYERPEAVLRRPAAFRLTAQACSVFSMMMMMM